MADVSACAGGASVAGTGSDGAGVGEWIMLLSICQRAGRSRRPVVGPSERSENTEQSVAAHPLGKLSSIHHGSSAVRLAPAVPAGIVSDYLSVRFEDPRASQIDVLVQSDGIAALSLPTSPDFFLPTGTN